MNDILNDIKAELSRAVAKHGSMKSFHEGIAVIREEYLELEAEVFKQHPDKYKLRHEAEQVAAMVVRFIYDLLEEVKG